MKLLNRNYSLHFLLSCIIHVVLIVLLSFSIQTGVRTASLANPQPEIVQASIVDEKLVEAEIKKLESVKIQEQKREALLAKKALEAKQEREKEQAKLAQLKKDIAKAQQQEEARLAEIKIAKAKEQKQLEELRLEKQKTQKKLAAIDEQRAEEQERALSMRLEREKEEKKKNDALKAKAEKEKAESEEKMALERSQWLQSESAKYDALLKQKVNQAWNRAPGLPNGLVCVLEIRLLPDGSLLGVQVVNSSGNLAFDQSAEAAIQKASPFPLPDDLELRKEYRQFNFTFDPSEVT